MEGAMGGAAEKIFRVLKKYGEVFLLWLLCAASVSATLYIYTDNVVNVYTIAGTALAIGLIKFFDFIRSKKFGGFMYFGTMVILFTITPQLFIGRSWDERFAFVRWFFSGAQAEETRAAFMLTLMPLMVFFLASAFYYFTRIIYRSSMLALVSLIPFALAVKAAAHLPGAYAVLMASLNLIFFIIDGRKNLLKGSAAGGTAGAAAAVYTDFALAAVLLALIAPKPSETPYYDKFEAAVNMFSFGGSGETEYQGEYKQAAGRVDELLRNESVLLYIIRSPESAYMKTQVFNIYDSESGLWTNDDETVRGSKTWQETASLLSFEKLAGAVRKVSEDSRKRVEESSYLGEEDMLISKHPWIEQLLEMTDTQTYSLVYAQNFPAVYLPAPLRTTEIVIPNENVSWVARSNAGEIFTDKAMLSPNVNYTVRYYSEKTQETLTENGYFDIHGEEWQRFLLDALFEAEMDSEEHKVLIEFLNAYSSAEDYRELYQTEIPSEIQALADELTEGLEYDHQKAQAIENYFTDGSFLYDLTFEPPEGMDTPEYFIFESKTGICSDFARAYTLLARAAGLTARYAEGFVPQKSADSEDVYFIYSDNAHAYPEVYIPAAGWMRFEPTPANYLGAGAGRSSEEEETDHEAAVLTVVVFAVGLGAFILLILLYPKIREGIFRVRAKHTASRKGVIMLYNRHIANAESRFKESFRAFTPEQMARFSEEKTGQSLEPLTKPFTVVCYGGGDIGRDAFDSAYECYKSQEKAMRKIYRGKKNKSNKTEG